MKIVLTAKCEGVGLVTKMREPTCLRHHQIEVIAMDDEVAAPVCAFMHDIFNNLYTAKMRAVVVAQEFVVVAGDVNDAHALARLAQQLLHHVVMHLRPIPARAKLPAVDDIADQIDRIGFVPAQEIEEPLRLASPRAEMHVGNKQRTEAAVYLQVPFVDSARSSSPCATSMPDSSCGFMTNDSMACVIRASSIQR